MHDLNIALAAIGGMILVLGLLSGLIKKRLYLSEPLVALLIGLLLGPAVTGLLDLERYGNKHAILEEAARLTMAIALMAVALRLPPRFLLRRRRPLLVLLLLVMPLMWLASSMAIYALLGVPLLVALLAGAVVIPTDPVVSAAITTGETAEGNLPQRVRRLIAAEAGANDGLAFPIVFLPLLLLTHSPGEAWHEWLTRVLLREVGGGIVMGALAGYGLGKLLLLAEKHKTIEQPSFLSTTIALSLGVLGAVKLLGGNAILAVFAAGIAFDNVVRGGERAQEESVQEAVNRFFTLPIFTLLGLALPWDKWQELGWRAPALAILVLLVRRLPFVLLVRPLLRPLPHTRDALFVGWFGPIGAAALYYATLSLRKTGDEQVWVVGTLIICASLVAHGISATPLTRWYGALRRGRKNAPATHPARS